MGFSGSLACHIDICQYVLMRPVCCTPVADQPISADDAEVIAVPLRALAEPTRLRIVSLLSNGGEVCVCDLTEPLALSQPTVSHHMKVLAEAGLVTREQRGKWAYYRLEEDALADVASALEPAGAAVSS